MPSNDSFNRSPADPGGVPASGGYSPEVYDLLLDAGGRLAAFYAASASRARSTPEQNRWLNKLAALREEIAEVDAESNVSVVGKRNELIDRYHAEVRGSEGPGSAGGPGRRQGPGRGLGSEPGSARGLHSGFASAADRAGKTQITRGRP
ncbi:hypothetical protein [Pseudoclavibacter helvolus]|uniref:hypothetical protein n=1 Tax=Pseudoclavibacter helvolus TaxID=255205 RepID=UPI003C7625F8